MPLALALTMAALAPAQSISVGASYYDGQGSVYDGGASSSSTYTATVDHNDYGQYFQRATASSSFLTTKMRAEVEWNGTAGASATVRDSIAIERPGGEGGWGVAYARVRAHANTNVDPVDGYRYDYTGASGQSTALLNLTVGQNAFSWKQQTDAYSLWEQESPRAGGESWTETRTELRSRMPDGSLIITKPAASNGDFYLPLYFSFGSSMNMTLTASVRAHLFNGGTVDTDFTHTYEWQGIDRVFALNDDGTQSLVPGWTVTSSSGANYAAPVPEPGSMVALGAGLLALLRRRKARA